MTEYSWEWIQKPGLPLTNNANIQIGGNGQGNIQNKIKYSEIIQNRVAEKIKTSADNIIDIVIHDNGIRVVLPKPNIGAYFYTLNDFLEWLDSDND